jgi:hypothetical protein
MTNDLTWRLELLATAAVAMHERHAVKFAGKRNAAFFARFFISRPDAARQAMLIIEVRSRRVRSDMAPIGLLAFVADRRDSQFRKLVL